MNVSVLLQPYFFLTKQSCNNHISTTDNDSEEVKTTMDSKAPAPAGGGGGTKKKRNRKKGAANSKSDGAPKDNAAQAAPSAAAGRGGKSKKRRGGGRGGGGGGGGGGESSNRFNKTAPSPLQLPHVKVTIRNIVDVNKHGTIEGIINSVKGFLEGAFPSTSSSTSSTHQTSKSGTANGGDNDYNPYTMAWHLEKDEFDSAKNMFADVATAAASSDANKSTGTANGSASGASSSTAATRAFSSGWVYDEKCLPHPITGTASHTHLPTCDSIVTKLLSNQTDKRISPTTNTNWIVDTAMSQMMGECSKEYLNLVGGQVMLDEESCLDVTLAEMVREERQKRLEREEKQRLECEQEEKEKDENDCQMDDADILAAAAAAAAAAENNASGEKKDKATSVDSVTKDLSKLSTTSETTTVKKQPTSSASQPPPSPTIRIRLLSITPVKKSKRRGEIGGKVTLALYPPDPCLLFKESCRDAAMLAAERHIEVKRVEMEERVKKAEEEEAKKKVEEDAKKEDFVAEEAAAVDVVDDGEAKNEDEPGKGEAATTPDGKEETKADEAGAPNGAEAKNGEPTTTAQDEKKTTKPKPTPPSPEINTEIRFPQIPYYPLLSPAERSRAIARSRVLLQRTITAMQLHAAHENTAHSKNWRDAINYKEWEIEESASQKTWKVRSHFIVGGLMEGKKELGALIDEHEKSSNTNASNNTAGGNKNKGRKGFFGDSRADRYDSTIEKSEDYKVFMESLKDGSDPTKKETTAVATADKDKGAKKGGDKSASSSDKDKKEESTIPTVDEEGRPISAIVQFFLQKQEGERKVRAEKEAAVAKARAAATAAKEKVRKEKQKAKKEAAKKKKKETSRSKKQPGSKSGSSSSRAGGGSSKGSSMAMPPPGAMLLKKGAGPPRGYG